MIDTINFRLYGINDMKKDNISAIKFENSGISQLCVIEHQMLFWKMLAYKGKSLIMRQVYNKVTQELTTINEEDYLTRKLTTNEVILNDIELQYSFMEIKDKDSVKNIALNTRGGMGNLENERLERANGEVRTKMLLNFY